MVTVAVVGGGFGGTYAIRTLHRARIRDLHIVLFEPREAFVFTPLLHEVAGGVLHTPSITHQYRDLFRSDVQQVRSRVVRVDCVQRIIFCEDGSQHTYEYLILAQGARTRLLREDAPVLQLKDPAHAIEIKETIHRNVSHAAEMLAKDPAADVASLLSCVIVGAGPTGVELSAELIDLYKFSLDLRNLRITPKVFLLHGGADILPTASERVRKIALRHLRRKGIEVLLRARVQNVEKKESTYEVTAVLDDEEKMFRAGCAIWTAGVVPNTIALNNIGLIDAHVPVDDTLRARSHPEVFAIGDAALVESAPLPDLAQVAVAQGVAAARNVVRAIRGKPLKRFRYKSKGFLVSLGQRYAAGDVLGVTIKGFLAWFLWRTIYLVKFVGTKSKVRMAKEYTIRLFQIREKSEC